MADRQKLYLVDGSGYIFRAYYAIRSLSTSTGIPTNAVTGFARMLGRLIKEESPALLGIAFDSKEKTFRHERYPAYKANRDQPPEDLAPQFGLVRELVAAMGIPVVALPGYEADDLIATLARQGVETGHDVVIVSADKDLMQLVAPRVLMLDPMKGKLYDRNAVVEKFGVPPELVADAQALSGDSGDNIPGVPKVGPKSAARLIAAFGDLEAVLEGVKTIEKPKAFERSVIENAESARLSKQLTTLANDAPVELDVEGLRYRAPDPETLGPFLRKIEAFSLLRDLGVGGEAAEAAAMAGGQGAGQISAPIIDRSTYRTLLTISAVKREVDAARAAGRLSIDLETTSLDANRAEIVGVAICVPARPAVYVPLTHRYLGVPKQPDRKAVLDTLRPVLEDETIEKVGQNLKYDATVFERAGISLSGIAHDTMLAAYVLDPARQSFSLDSLAREILGHETIHYKDLTGTGKRQIGFDEVDVARASEYAAEDADVALRLCEVLDERVEQAGLTKLYRHLEMPLLPVLARMERTGIRVDIEQLRALSTEFTDRLRRIEARAHDMIGERINLASPRQLATVFFDKLGYPVIKKTKTGPSTDQSVLETLARDYELPGVVLEHRLLAKLKSTYVDALPAMVNPHTGRVHTSFNQTGAATGRLSSTDPNLQNIPIRSEDGRRIRTAFVPEAGWTMVSADYSQIELRVVAHLSGDPDFIDAFERGEDIHERTAREVLTAGVPPDAEQRRRAKAINFGILYGLSEFGLSRQLEIPRAEAKAYITTYFARYPKIREFLDASIESGREIGYVSTIGGRRRFLPDLQSNNRNIRQAAERIAMNTPIQGSAADLIKIAMLRVDAALCERRLRARLLLQVHDELVLEAPRDEIATVVDLVRQEMSSVMTLSVPLVVDVGTGDNWTAAH